MPTISAAPTRKSSPVLTGSCTKLVIRSATSADIPAMMALEREAATAAHWSRAQYDAIFRTALPRRLCLVSESSQSLPELQAFLVAREIAREWELENVVVSAGSQRRGLGLQLLLALLDAARARAAEAVFLEVRESNLAARRLYEKAGFIHKGVRGGYYRNPEENAALYRLNFL